MVYQDICHYFGLKIYLPYLIVNIYLDFRPVSVLFNNQELIILTISNYKQSRNWWEFKV
jgi:hypothetical protein